MEMTASMKIHLSPLAAAKLKLILFDAKQESSQPLVVRLVPLTSGCNTPSFALELTEMRPNLMTTTIEEICLAWHPRDAAWIDGLTIDLNRENGKFDIFQPHPPKTPYCPIETN
jgi:Fe-S cluster assembly iron-binding protein IscA